MEAGARRPFVEHLADLDTEVDELVAGGLDIGDDQVQALRGAGHGRREVRAELDRAVRARRRELDDAEVLTAGPVRVEPPAEPAVELLRAFGIRDGDDDHLELLVHAASLSCVRHDASLSAAAVDPGRYPGLSLVRLFRPGQESSAGGSMSS